MSEATYTVGLEDLSLAARIREVALELIAELGVNGTSIRKVAEAAGVSTGAVMHYYKSKDELLTAVHASVSERIRQTTSAISLEFSPEEIARMRREAYDNLMLESPTIAAYVRHMYLDGGSEGVDYFRQSMDFVRHELDHLVDVGVARALPDQEFGAVLYAALLTFPNVFSELIEATMNVDMSDPKVRERFRDAAVDLLTHPLFPTKG